ncbi:MAG TPA: hypothetical protein VLX91_04565 [Candidatus Acidoferrales bacterium]|nr:hypothetical protein [Candidatus Acidoferrales bacterium]
MKTALRLLFLAPYLSLCTFLCAPVFSQTRAEFDSTLSSIKSLYDSGSYISSELLARRTLEEKNLPDSLRVQFEKYIAFSSVAQGKNDAAIGHFENALEVDHNFTLDPVLTSPKILEVFEIAKAEAQRQRQSGTAPDYSSKGGFVQSDNEGPTFRAVIFPGWEQSYQGEEVKGHVLLGAGAVSAISFVSFDFLRRGARTSYLNASTPSSASSRYKTYNLYYQSEFYSASAFVLVYAYSAVDAFIKLPPYFSLDYTPRQSTANLVLKISF